MKTMMTDGMKMMMTGGMMDMVAEGIIETVTGSVDTKSDPEDDDSFSWGEADKGEEKTAPKKTAMKAPKVISLEFDEVIIFNDSVNSVTERRNGEKFTYHLTSRKDGEVVATRTESAAIRLTSEEARARYRGWLRHLREAPLFK